MYHLDTPYPTIIFEDGFIDPSIMDHVIKKKNKKRISQQLWYKNKYNPYVSFICDIASRLLNLHNFNHNRDIWYIDLIRYQFNNVKKPVKSGLAWHCENDNDDDLITVLFYLHMDETIINGNLMYEDKDNVKNVITIKSGITVIMDGRVRHKPQNPYGLGKRDLIAVSFRKIE